MKAQETSKGVSWGPAPRGVLEFLGLVFWDSFERGFKRI